MHCGAAKGQMETLKVVWSRGGNLWTRTARGDYPLHEAVTSGRTDLVLWLLSLRPDAITAPNNDGRCPLHLAAIHNNVEMCKVKYLYILIKQKQTISFHSRNILINIYQER